MSGKSPLHKFTYWLILVLLMAGLLVGCKVAPDSGDGLTSQLPQPKTISDPEWIKLQQAIQAAAEGREDEGQHHGAVHERPPLPSRLGPYLPRQVQSAQGRGQGRRDG